MKLSQDEIKKIKQEAIRLDGVFFSIDEAVFALDYARSNGQNIYIDFNGRIFYSLFDDEDSCYKRVAGVNKQEYDASLQQNQPGLI